MTGTAGYQGLADGMHTWRLRVWVTDPDHPRGGKQVSETVRFKATGSGTASKAADKALAVFVDRVQVEHGTQGDKTVQWLWCQWLDHITHTRQLSPLTIRGYVSPMESSILPKLGKHKLRDMNSHVLDRFYAGQIAKGLSPTTVKNQHRILSSMFRQAERWGWIKISPTRNATAPRSAMREIEAPPLALVRALVQEASIGNFGRFHKIGRYGSQRTMEKIGLLIALAPATGARRGELVGLRWDDIDFQTGVLSISRSAYRLTGQKATVKSTKSGKSRRVSLDEPVLAALSRAYKIDECPSGYIFTDDGVTPWAPDRITHAFTALRDRVPGAESVRFHDLRHFSATQLLAAGIDMTTVSKRLGHAKVSTTVDIYSHVLEQKDRDAADILGSLLLS